MSASDCFPLFSGRIVAQRLTDIADDLGQATKVRNASTPGSQFS
jgi:hypothetical protein